MGRYKQGKNIACCECGLIVYRKPHHIKKCKTGMFVCSSQCRRIMLSKYLHQPKAWCNQPENYELFRCTGCNKKVHRIKDRYANRKSKYCSISCMDKTRATKGRGFIERWGEEVGDKKYGIRLLKHFIWCTTNKKEINYADYTRAISNGSKFLTNRRGDTVGTLEYYEKNTVGRNRCWNS